jgi:trimeric autotransporter adhesin
MSNGRTFSGKRLSLTAAFAVLLVAAFGAGCRGFFQSATIASFVIKPANTTVPLDGTSQLHAFGTDSDGNPTGDITDKITWSSDESGSVSVGETTGLLTGVSLSTTAATITGSYQALPDQTATASVCVENGTNFAILPNDASITGSTTSEVDYTASAVVQGSTVDITTGVQWSSSNTAVATIVSGTDPAIASITDPTAQTTLVITASYTCNGTTNTFSTNLTVSP